MCIGQIGFVRILPENSIRIQLVGQGLLTMGKIGRNWSTGYAWAESSCGN